MATKMPAGTIGANFDLTRLEPFGSDAQSVAHLRQESIERGLKSVLMRTKIPELETVALMRVEIRFSRNWRLHFRRGEIVLTLRGIGHEVCHVLRAERVVEHDITLAPGAGILSLIGHG